MRWVLSFTVVRLVAMLVLVAGVWVAVQIVVALIARGRSDEVQLAVITIGWILLAFAVLGTYRLGVRLVERRSAAELDGAWALPSFGAGTGLGVFLMTTVYVVLWSIAVAHVEGLGSVSRLLPILALSAGSAVSEELIFRGVLFRIVEEGFGTAGALAVSAAVFGGLHSWNPGASVASAAAIALEAGVLLGLAYAGSRTLWLPIGLHFGWNFTEGGIFGGAVSGFPAEGLIDVKLKGPDILTGGAFGPEASAVTIAVCLAASLIFLLASIRHGQWRGLRLRLRHPGGE